MHRYEPSGALHGLMRVRAFTQDDAHIFITEDQITDGVGAQSCKLLLDIYRDFGFDDVRDEVRRPAAEARRRRRDLGPRREGAAVDATRRAGIEYTLNPGEGAFYGPKLEFVLRDAIGRDWQCGTLQVDLNIAAGSARLTSTSTATSTRRSCCTARSSARWSASSACCSSTTRAGCRSGSRPVQAVVATITSDADRYAEQVVARLGAAGLRATVDLRNEKIDYKVREHSLAKIPVLIAVGKREVAESTVAIRRSASNSKW